jgi:ABC-type sugar transport system substrate-binding protein
MRIIVSLPDQQNEFQLLQAADARGTAARLGLEVEVLDGGADPALQVDALLKTLDSEPRPRAVIVEPAANGILEPVARKAVAHRAGFFVMNAPLACLDELRREFPTVPTVVLGSDQIEIGRVQGRQLKILLPSGGNVLYVHGPDTVAAARERFLGTQEVLGPAYRLSVVYGHWSEDSAEAAVREWLRGASPSAPIHAVAAQDDSMARGARAALEAAGPRTPGQATFYLGIDGLPAYGRRLVDEERLTATVVMPSNTGPALELVHRHTRTGQPPPPRVQLYARSYPSEDELSYLQQPPT